MNKNIVVLLLSVVVLFSACKKKNQDGDISEGIPVSIAAAVAKDVPVSLNATGTVEPIKTVNLMAQVDGRIVKIYAKDGQRLRTGDAIMDLDSDDLKQVLSQAQAQLAQDLDNLSYAKVQSERYAELVKKGAAAQSDADQADTAYKTTLSKVAADKASVEQAKVNLAYTKVKAPIDGKAGSFQVKEGGSVQKNSTNLLVINQISPIYVKFSVPEKYIRQVETAKHAGSVLITAVPEGGKASEGTLTFVDNAINQDTGMIMLRGTFQNKDESLWPGQFTTVTMVLGTEKNAVTVPSSAIMSTQDGKSVFVVRADNTVELKKVTVDRVVADDAVITSGIANGDNVVTDGQMLLKEGAKVQLKTAIAPTSQK